MRSLALPLGGSLLLGSAALWLWNGDSTVPARASVRHDARVAMTEIAVAAEDLDPGTPLAAEQVRWVSWPRQARLAGQFERGDAPRLAGSIVRMRVLAGEPINEARLARRGNGGAMAAAVRPSMRAISVPVPGPGGLAGQLAAEDRVDIILSGTDRSGAPVGGIVAKDVRVIGNTAAQADGGAVVTLEVSATQAERIAMAREQGRLSLALRNPADRDGAEMSDTDIDRPPATRAAPAVPARAAGRRAAPVNVEVVRGTIAS